MQQKATEQALDDVTDAVLTASRVLVGIAAASIGPIEDQVTLSQYRALVVLHGRGPQSLAQLAAELQVVPSTATRMCDRLERKHLIERHPVPGNRREVEVRIADEGRRIVAQVARHRRRTLRSIVDRLGVEERGALVLALTAFADAAGEVPEQQWYLGWG